LEDCTKLTLKEVRQKVALVHCLPVRPPRSERPHHRSNQLEKTFLAEELPKTFLRKVFAKTSPLEELLNDRANADLTN